MYESIIELNEPTVLFNDKIITLEKKEVILLKMFLYCVCGIIIGIIIGILIILFITYDLTCL